MESNTKPPFNNQKGAEIYTGPWRPMGIIEDAHPDDIAFDQTGKRIVPVRAYGLGEKPLSPAAARTFIEINPCGLSPDTVKILKAQRRDDEFPEIPVFDANKPI